MVYAGFKAGGEFDRWNRENIAGERLFIQVLKQVGNIVYAGIEDGKKNCLWKGLRTV